MTPAELQQLRRRLDALRAMTAERGCSEAEALLAAERYAELLSRHGLTEGVLDDLDYAEVEVPLAARRSVVDAVWGRLAEWGQCLGYIQSEGRRRTFVYFGRVEDVLVAEYAHEVIARAIAGAAAAFRASPDYRRRRLPRTRAAAMRAWEFGLAARLADGLQRQLWARERPRHDTFDASHRAIARRREALEERLARRGVTLSASRRRAQAPDRRYGGALAAGAAAGGEIRVDAPLAADRPTIAGLIR